MEQALKNKILTYLATLFTLLACDGLWLGLIAKESYLQSMAHIMREEVINWPWIAFYLLYPLPILFFAISAQQKGHASLQFAIRGFALGATAYGTYNLTNYALVVDWPLFIMLKDWLWGSVLTAFCAWVGGLVWIKYSDTKLS